MYALAVFLPYNYHEMEARNASTVIDSTLVTTFQNGSDYTSVF
jgi:hypothetical protein